MKLSADDLAAHADRLSVAPTSQVYAELGNYEALAYLCVRETRARGDRGEAASDGDEVETA